VPDAPKKLRPRQQLAASLQDVSEQLKFARPQINLTVATFGGPIEQIKI